MARVSAATASLTRARRLGMIIILVGLIVKLGWGGSGTAPLSPRAHSDVQLASRAVDDLELTLTISSFFYWMTNTGTDPVTRTAFTAAHTFITSIDLIQTQVLGGMTATEGVRGRLTHQGYTLRVARRTY